MTVADRPGLTAVIPAYNEDDTIASVVAEAQCHADEVIVVDDASSDDTVKAASAAGARVERQPENRGYIAAIKRGFRRAAQDIVVTLDGDGELPASAIPRLVAPIIEGRADMVQGARPRPPRPSEAALTWLANRVAPVGDTGTGLRALRIDLARELEIRGRCICGVLALEAHRRGARLEEIPIELRDTGGSRGIAWQHFEQFFWLFLEMSKHLGNAANFRITEDRKG